MAELKKGARITGGDRSKLAADLKRKYTSGGEHPLAGGRDRPLLRVRAPHAERVRGAAARPRRRHPRQEVLTSSATPAVGGDGVELARDGELATVTLDRPERRNAQTPGTWRALAAIGRELLADGSVRVVVLRAEGPSFSAGLDRAMFTPGLAG